jgi:hypothetical protein
MATDEHASPCQAVPRWISRCRVVNAASHVSPPTVPEHPIQGRIGNAEKTDLAPTDHACLSLSKLGQGRWKLLVCSHIRSLRTRQ